jgi:ABC-type Fe3+ transport system substrate-binding protein
MDHGVTLGRLLGLLLAAVLSLACAGIPPAASQPPTAPSQPVAPGAGSPDWRALAQAAAPEGRVVVTTGAAVDPAWRTMVNDTFGQRFDLSVEVLAMSSGELSARAKREAQVGQLSVDVNIGGAPTGWSLAAADLLDPIRPWLVVPEVTNPDNWRGGRLKLLDPEPHYHLQTAEWLMTDLTINREQIPLGQPATWQDLLRPEYRGKIAAFDPRAPGAGLSTATHLYARFGQEFLEKLYVGQAVQLTRDNRQLAEWVARGTYPVGLGMLPATIELMSREGFKLERVFPSDDPHALTGGSSAIVVFKSAPHPNAAKLFINWFASREGQDVWAKTVREPTLRTDVDLSPVPSYIVPRAGVEYAIDEYNYEWFTHYQTEANERLLALLGR